MYAIAQELGFFSVSDTQMWRRRIICRFGEEIPAGYAGRSASLLFGASDGIEQKFTGQVRDSETGMDFFAARYYASAVGGFTSPDPMNLGANPTDPQSWNAYAYVRNNPLALVNPSGVVLPSRGSIICRFASS